MNSMSIAKMNLFKLLTITLISIFFSGFIYADGNQDAYFSLEKEIEKLRAQLKKNQDIIRKLETSTDLPWDEGVAKEMLDRTRNEQEIIQEKIDSKMKEMKRLEQSLLERGWSDMLSIFEGLNAYMGEVSKKIDTFLGGTSEAKECFSKKRLWVN